MDVESGAAPDNVNMAVRPRERAGEFGVQTRSIKQVEMGLFDMNQRRRGAGGFGCAQLVSVYDKADERWIGAAGEVRALDRAALERCHVKVFPITRKTTLHKEICVVRHS